MTDAAASTITTHMKLKEKLIINITRQILLDMMRNCNDDGDEDNIDDDDEEQCGLLYP